MCFFLFLNKTKYFTILFLQQQNLIIYSFLLWQRFDYIFVEEKFNLQLGHIRKRDKANAHQTGKKNLNSRFSQQIEYGVINIEYTHIRIEVEKKKRKFSMND
jgi:hypothetical protein